MRKPLSNAQWGLVKDLFDPAFRPGRPARISRRWVSDASPIGGMGIRFTDVSFEDRVVLSSLGLAGLVEEGQGVPAS